MVLQQAQWESSYFDTLTIGQSSMIPNIQCTILCLYTVCIYFNVIQELLLIKMMMMMKVLKK